MPQTSNDNLVYWDTTSLWLAIFSTEIHKMSNHNLVKWDTQDFIFKKKLKSCVPDRPDLSIFILDTKIHTHINYKNVFQLIPTGLTMYLPRYTTQ